VQLTDHRLIGRFDHIFQAYHQYDVAVIGDHRTRIAYRRSSKEVSEIPPMALAFFDNWQAAAAGGFDPHPRSFGRHYTAASISNALEAEVLAFVNRASAKQLVAAVADNPYVDAGGRLEVDPTPKRGIDKATAERIVAARKKLKRFTSLDQIDAVRGVGPDTLSDIISSVLLARQTKVRRSAAVKWQANEAVLGQLLPSAGKKGRKTPTSKKRKKAVRKGRKKRG
jgi:hypothetical protein